MRYLTAVAIADLCSLYSWNLNLFYKHLINPYQNDLEDGSIFVCRLISFIGFVSLQLSSWYLTLVSIDRCLNIKFLFWHRQLGRASRSVYIILGLTLIIILLNSHLLVLNGYKQSGCTPYAKRTCLICYARPTDRHYIFPKWEKIHVVIYNLIPFSIMLFSTCFIIRRSIPSANMQRTLSTDQSKGSTRGNYRQRKQRQLTYILLSVIFLFVLLTTPVMIYNVFLRNYLKHQKPLKYIVHGILLCVQFTSHAVGRWKEAMVCNFWKFVLDQFLRLLLWCIEISWWTERILHSSSEAEGPSSFRWKSIILANVEETLKTSGRHFQAASLTSRSRTVFFIHSRCIQLSALRSLVRSLD